MKVYVSALVGVIIKVNIQKFGGESKGKRSLGRWEDNIK